MNLYALRIFYHVAKKGSVTRAAKELLLSQPAVTGQIRNLEKELQITLLAPKGRGIMLTEAGGLLFSHAERLFSLEQEIEESLLAFKNGKAGKIRIAATYLPANYLLPTWLSVFRKQNKKIEVSLTTCNAKGAIEQLLQYKVDIAVIGGGTEKHPEVASEELFLDEFWFIVPKDHHLALSETSLRTLMQEPFVLREEGSSTRKHLFALCKTLHIQQPVEAISCSGLNETIRAVMAGYGAAFVSALEAQEYIERNDVARVMIPHVSVKNPVTLYTRKDDVLAPAADQCVQHLLKMSRMSPEESVGN